jgi:ParB/RepB/Spo0J family partition protein
MYNESEIEDIAVSDVGEEYGIFRIVRPAADLAMVKSIQRYGQMSPVVCVKIGEGYELIDGFKRLRACRRLNKPALKAKTVDFSKRVCKAAIIQLNRGGGSITEMEEALVLRSLHREDGLLQVEIAALVGRHKSWVSRRISLIERLSEEVQEDVRLGLLSPSIGRELAKLPRGNQQETLFAVRKHRMNKREVEKLIPHLLSRPQWEYKTILWAPWEIIDRRQPRPTVIAGRLISFEHVCTRLLEEISKSKIEDGLYGHIDKAACSAEEVGKTLRALSEDMQVQI